MDLAGANLLPRHAFEYAAARPVTNDDQRRGLAAPQLPGVDEHIDALVIGEATDVNDLPGARVPVHRLWRSRHEIGPHMGPLAADEAATDEEIPLKLRQCNERVDVRVECSQRAVQGNRERDQRRGEL